jgi:hypothetical protein
MRLGNLEAAERADQLLDEGDLAGAETWHRILNAIERLQAKAPAEGERRAVGAASSGPPPLPIAASADAMRGAHGPR